MAEVLDKAMVATVDEKGFVPDDVRNAFFRKLRMKNDNRSCFECTNRNPTWISLTYGIYLCLECSGEHRRKGVHLSFVRSVELDRFTPEQMAQMAVGGNGKALEYFKSSGMGKLCDSGRTVDYNSKITHRYKENMEVAAADLCRKLEVKGKEAAIAAAAAVVAAAAAPVATAPHKAVDPVDLATDFLGLDAAPSPIQRGASAPATNGYPKAASPLPTAPPSTVKVFRQVESSEPPKPSGFVPKQKAKAMDFDFDFDDLDKEASKPKLAPAPKAAVTAPAPAPAREFVPPKPAATTSTSSTAPAAADTAKFANKKGISSDDYFHEERNTESAADREGRYNKFQNSGAISSSAFFGDGQAAVPRSPSGGDGVDWGDLASKSSDMAKKGAEMITTYINKTRN